MSTVDEYIDAQGVAQQALLRELRTLVHDLVPDVGERISYGIPTFTLNGNLVHIGAASRHVGLYPGADGVTAFLSDLDDLGLSYSKGAIQFPLDQPLPRALITRIVAFRADQQRSKAAVTNS